MTASTIDEAEVQRWPDARDELDADAGAMASTTAPSRPATRAPAAPDRELPCRTLPRRARNVVLAAHIAVSVALLGDVAGLAAISLKTMGTDDPDSAHTLYDVLSMFSLAFGIPLS